MLLLVHATPDDLVTPLGQGRPARRGASVRLPVARLAAGVAALAFGGLALHVALVDDPLGGEPHVIVPIVRAPVAVAQASEPAEGRQGAETAPGLRTRSTAAELEGEAGVAVVRPEGQAPGAIVIRVPDQATVRLAPAPDRRLVERTRFGLLPRIGADGARPAEVYARPAGTLPGGARPAGRIAVVVGGLGIGQNATAEAIARLPGPVTLAFAPYGGNLDAHVARARDEGHEVMLQVPMEPFDYPDNDPGPHTLLAQAKIPDNLERLRWVMGRFTGYTGLVNFMGAKLTADEAALAPVLREVGERGLFFLDDGSSSRSSVATVAPAAKVSAARADVVLDGLGRAEAIDAELARAEKLARERGLAIVSASALPIAVERIARWASDLEAKGILLVPASAAVGSRPRG
ncbi:divergent polysaccharide deacetylase family protein [Chelatococcus sp. SYSU_G07232]|uniref:Divergent polysaccharide deacetylase family protein n=1 Tax=Chelatococcus albus TaxID=3047466 RepID=A0ABT7ADU5_9HYPH|nr:divergent polysaccharide deacetylase family protein [Chelatococcus sp. SYSU_G07232]MDJ1157547.1 divergent polysaccharide deacetylase family protein [Chelatococcus sp. SYSU_G07232]